MLDTQGSHRVIHRLLTRTRRLSPGRGPFGSAPGPHHPHVVHRRLHNCGHGLEGYRDLVETLDHRVQVCATVGGMQHLSPGRQGRSRSAPSGHLDESTVVVWRAPTTAQLELEDRRVVVEDVGAAELSWLLHRPAVRSRPPASARLARLARQLDDHGFLRRPRGEPDEASRVPGRLVADQAVLTSRHGDTGAAVLANRRRSAVSVHGGARIAVPLASTLAAAGVGRIKLVHVGEVSVTDACPAGLGPADEGSRFMLAAERSLRRAAPDVDTRPFTMLDRPDLVVLTDWEPADPAVRDGLHLDGTAHLSASVRGSRAVIGPLVIPGLTSCLRCADLHRQERDPAWPAMAVQLSGASRSRAGSDTALCLAAAGVAAGQALSFLDGQRPTTVDGTVEWHWPDWRLRRRTWSRHARCDCGAPVASGDPDGHGRMRW